MIDSCDFSNSKKTKEQLSKIFKDRIKYLETSDQINNYIDKVRSKLLSVSDEYYISLLNYMSENRSSAGLNAYAGKNVFDEYRYRVCNEADIAKPYIQNELLAYALKPTLRYGTYIPDFTVMEDDKGVVL